MYKNKVTMSAREYLLTKLPKQAILGELGVWKGDFSKKMLEVCNPALLVLVDKWEVVTGFNYAKAWYGANNITQKEMTDIYLSVVNRFRNNSNVVVVKTATGLSGLGYNFDAVYIDADHTYEAVKKDLTDADKRVKSGGIIAGDDFALGGWWGDGVVRAVREFTEEKNYSYETFGNQFMIYKSTPE